jgi:hypothetical protein
VKVLTQIILSVSTDFLSAEVWYLQQAWHLCFGLRGSQLVPSKSLHDSSFHAIVGGDIYVAEDALGFYGEFVHGERKHWRFVEHDITPVKRTKYKLWLVSIDISHALYKLRHKILYIHITK